TQRDLIAGEISKEISKHKLIPKHIVKAHNDGVLHWHDMDYTLQPIHNCFKGDTKFISSTGTVAFNQFKDGDEVYVPTHTGEWKKAIVKKYGFQDIYKTTFRRNGTQTKTIYCTKDHRWILRNGETTTSLKIGDRLIETPIIDKFDINKMDIIETKAWCIGFILGDGTDYNHKDSFGVQVRLCGEKNKYLSHFKSCGYSHYQIKGSNDNCVIIPKMRKQEFLNNQSYKKLSTLEQNALIDGLFSADANKGKTRILTSDHRIKTLILDLSEKCGYYIGKVTEATGEITNYAPNGRKESYYIHFNKKQYRSRWRVVEQEYHSIDEVWCLTVEDNKSFILSGGIVTGNCDLVNLEDMFANGTVINGKLVETPKSFQTACTVATQIMTAVSSSQ
ncbi:MAG: anaerobic ribonucleoside-triphosphate reductase, partial [Peptostreptococcaceae bacterium]